MSTTPEQYQEFYDSVPNAPYRSPQLDSVIVTVDGQNKIAADVSVTVEPAAGAATADNQVTQIAQGETQLSQGETQIAQADTQITQADTQISLLTNIDVSTNLSTSYDELTSSNTGSLTLAQLDTVDGGRPLFIKSDSSAPVSVQDTPANTLLVGVEANTGQTATYTSETSTNTLIIRSNTTTTNALLGTSNTNTASIASRVKYGTFTSVEVNNGAFVPLANNQCLIGVFSSSAPYAEISKLTFSASYSRIIDRIVANYSCQQLMTMLQGPAPAFLPMFPGTGGTAIQNLTGNSVTVVYYTAA